MKIVTAILAAALSTRVSAIPRPLPQNTPGVFKCPAGLYSNPQCCSTDVLGIAGLDCKNPSSAPTSGDNFKSICAAAGKQPKCCSLPVAGQSLLCQDVIGGGNPGGSNPGGNNPGDNPPSGGNPGGNNPGGNNPGGNNPGGNNPGGGSKACPSGLYSQPQCCSSDVLGIAALDCATPSSNPTSVDQFKSLCSAAGKQAACCVVPVAGQSILCTEPRGGSSSGGSNPGGNNPGGNPPGGNNPGGNNPGGNNPGGNNPGGNNPGGNPGGNNPGGNNPGGNDSESPVCPKGLYSNPQCCSTDVLGLANLDCAYPSSSASPNSFKSACGAAGKQARCCAVPVAGQSLLCTDPLPSSN
ncbi:beta ketoadipyl CoA thiolase, th1 [Orbilia ellipsospora]|uniref:Beta ketoadipyl CoA thiolase, th1 n=1 Tax=Orbilia ellipsospora TaxID=2528407 RepID=A0AAV9XLN6_9PEZI